jgi:hypothetical protein
VTELDLTCVASGFNSDDALEFTAHCRGHETAVDDWVHAADIWSELAA